MTAKEFLSWKSVAHLADGVARSIRQSFQHQSGVRVYGIPRGGVHATQAVALEMYRSGSLPVRVDLTNDVEQADVFIDDIVDSGATRSRYLGYGKPFYSLVDKLGADAHLAGRWIVFPWEEMAQETGPEDAVIRLLEYFGEDPKREGLIETPKRLLKSWGELLGGYSIDPQSLMKTFQDGSCDEMVVLKDIEFASLCEHHILPFFGKAHVAYIPDSKVVGVSKLARLVDVYSRRLQIQERLCQQITKALDDCLNPRGSACILEAKHLCMVCRGVQKQHSTMITSSLTGVFRDDKKGARSELMNLINRR